MDESRESDESEGLHNENTYQQSLLKLIFELTPIGLAVVKSPDLIFQMANSAYQKCLPAADLDPIDQRYEEVWPPDNGFESLALVQEVIETGEAFDSDDYELNYPDGKARNFGLRLRRLPWGEALAVLIITWDITELAQGRSQSKQIVRSRAPELEAALEECKEIKALQGYLFQSTEAERKELSERLHNGPMQELYAVLFQLHSLQGELEQEAMIDVLSPIVARITRVSQVLRKIYNELWPTTLNAFGLASAIKGHLNTVQESHPEIEFRVDLASSGKNLPEDLGVAIFRIYQEGIANVIEHAEAKRVDIRFSIGDEIVLEIQDDGQGFEVPESWEAFARNGQFGLMEAAERARCLGGKLEVLSEGGQGTQLRVFLPRSEA